MGSATATARRDPPRGARRRRRFSALTRKVLAVNLLALGIVVVGVFHLDQYRRGLIQGRLDALAAQGRIVAAALAETAVPVDPAAPQYLDVRRARQLAAALMRPVGPRARVFDAGGELVADSRGAARAGVAIRELPPPETAGPVGSPLRRAVGFLDRRLTRYLPRAVEEEHQRAEYYAEAVAALRGEVDTQARRGSDGRIALSIGVPIARFKKVVGALLITAGTPGVEDMVRETRRDVLLLALGVLCVTVLLSLYLAGTLTRPVRRLAAAAERVTAGRDAPAAIPDLSGRGDEIGDLSLALRRMTEELRDRVDEIERFAADVAHELKNPLSSLRSAAETFVRVEDPEARRRLRDIIVQDIGRMDRLIGDISDASRLDAELSRAPEGAVDLAALLRTLVSVERAKLDAEPDEIGPEILFEAEPSGAVPVTAIEDRLGQVFRNLIDNAVSFSPPDGAIRIRLTADADSVRVSVEDDGPGLPPGKLSAVFDRFYSERPPGEAFGLHSGLGLNIARRIVEAHGGRLNAENRPGATPGAIAGARFVVRLPR